MSELRGGFNGGRSPPRIMQITLITCIITETHYAMH